MSLHFFNDMRNPPVRLAIVTDSRSSLMALESGRSKERLEIQSEVREIAHQLIVRGKDLAMVWVPSHTSLRGNDLADHEAKKAALGIKSLEIKVGVSAKEQSTMLTGAAWTLWGADYTKKSGEEGWWQSSPPTRGFSIPGGGWIKSLLHRLRTNAWRAKHTKPTPTCHCGEILSINHILVECQQELPSLKETKKEMEDMKLDVSLRNLLEPHPTHGWYVALKVARAMRDYPQSHLF